MGPGRSNSKSPKRNGSPARYRKSPEKTGRRCGTSTKTTKSLRSRVLYCHPPMAQFPSRLRRVGPSPGQGRHPARHSGGQWNGSPYHPHSRRRKSSQGGNCLDAASNNGLRPPEYCPNQRGKAQGAPAVGPNLATSTESLPARAGAPSSLPPPTGPQQALSTQNGTIALVFVFKIGGKNALPQLSLNFVKGPYPTAIQFLRMWSQRPLVLQYKGINQFTLQFALPLVTAQMLYFR